MIKGGYILQPRCWSDSESAHMPPATRELWLYLLRKVNHKDKGQLKRGQGFFNFGNIQEDLAWFVGYRKETYSKSQLVKSLRRLNEGNMTASTKTSRGVIVTICNYDYYQDPKNYEGTNEGHTKETREKREGHTINKNEKNEEERNTVDPIPFSEIISYLNEKTGSSFKASTSATQSFIKARWNEGFRLDDFRTVVDKKTAEWKDDERFSSYLRPATLFGTKFESYLQSGVKGQKQDCKQCDYMAKGRCKGDKEDCTAFIPRVNI